MITGKQEYWSVIAVSCSQLPSASRRRNPDRAQGQMQMFGLQDKGKSAPAAVRALFAKRLLKKVVEAYGRMLLIKGLFQADCHPGNILIREDNDLGAVNQLAIPFRSLGSLLDEVARSCHP